MADLNRRVKIRFVDHVETGRDDFNAPVFEETARVLSVWAARVESRDELAEALLQGVTDLRVWVVRWRKDLEQYSADGLRVVEDDAEFQVLKVRQTDGPFARSAERPRRRRYLRIEGQR